MPITRLGVANPAANTDTSLVVFSKPHLVSVIAANKSITASPQAKVSIWVAPANATIAAQYAYIGFNINLSLGQSFETFRFAVNEGDNLYVRSTVSTVSFSCSGIVQSDAGQPENLIQTLTNKTIFGRDNTLYIDQGSTAERPASAGVGYIRFNTETENLEVKALDGWKIVSAT
jgi:glucose/arabinose dehydrogenase